MVAAGTLADVDVRGALVRSVPINDPLAAGAIQLPIKAASPGLFRAVRAELATGRLFDAGHSAPRRPRRSCSGPTLRGASASTRVDQQPAVFVGDRLYAVIGLLAGVEPSGLAARRGDHARGHGAPRVRPARRRRFAQVETRVGAVDLIARQAPLALSPSDRAC